MASRKILLPSPEKPKTRNTRWRSSMSAMKPGVVCFRAKLLPRLQPTICPCMSSTLTSTTDDLLILHSLNVTAPNSIGFIRRDDPIYCSLPPDSRKAPAPIDHSGKTQPILFIVPLLTLPLQFPNGSTSPQLRCRWEPIKPKEFRPR
jgi:hypothetical protein